jgi:hypothetical protein
MNATQSRRRFLGVLSAGAAATVAPAALAATPWHPFLKPRPAPSCRPWRPHPRMRACCSCSTNTLPLGLSTAGSRERPTACMKSTKRPPLPAALRVQPGDAELGLPELPSEHVERAFGYDLRIQELQSPEWPVVETIEPPEGLQFYSSRGGEVVHYAPPSAAARARADEIIKAHAKWDRERDREPTALRAASRQRDAASKLADRLRSKIDRTRARTAAGLAVKAQVAAIEGEDDTQFADYTLASILRDMKALKGRAQS